MSETKLALIGLRAREGAERIGRQEQLVAMLDRDGRDNMLPRAHRLLAELRGIQALFEEHLARCHAEVKHVEGEE